MKCFFLDIASHEGILVCVTKNAVEASETCSTRISDKDLIPMAEKVLKRAGWSYEDLTHIACIIGPGGFTSLRIAVTFANTLGDQLGIPVAGIHLSDLYGVRAWGVGHRKWNEDYWLHSTKKDQLFIRGGRWKESTLITIEALQDHIQHSTIQPFNHSGWMGELIEEHRALVGKDAISLSEVKAVLPEFLSTLNYTKEILLPWYGRGW